MKQKFIFLKSGLSPIGNVISLKEKPERCIFLVFFILYVIFSFLLYSKYKESILLRDFEILNYDIGYWSYTYSRIGSFMLLESVRHPCIYLLLCPFLVLFAIIRVLFGKYVLHILFIMFLFNYVGASTVSIIYKYSHNLLGLDNRRSLIICSLYGVFAHVFLLSLFPETFLLSAWVLLIMTYLTTENILFKKKIPLVTNIIMFCIISGITITNSLKALIAEAFQRNKRKIKTIIISGLVCLGFIVFSFLTTYLLSLMFYGKLNFYDGSASFVSSVFDLEWKELIHRMFFEPILFHHNYDFISPGGVSVSLEYNTLFAAFTCLILYVLLGISIIVSIRERVVLLLLSFISVDFLIHVICGFGIAEPYIYSLHWLFTFPLLIAWSYKKIKNDNVRKIIDVVLLFLICSTVANNLPVLIDFLS